MAIDDSYLEDFEKAKYGGIPNGWIPGTVVPGTTFEAAAGSTGTLLVAANSTAGLYTARTATLKHPLDVARYRGKRLSVTARVGCDTKSWWSYGRVGVDVTTTGAPLPSRSDEIATPDPHERRAVVDVPSDATAVEIVLAATGNLVCRFDDVAVRVLGSAGAGDESPSVLAGRALENVVAFARLYGVVRYFHPSDEAAALGEEAWRRLLYRGVRLVERAPDPAALSAQLQHLFSPIAPSVEIAREGELAAMSQPSPPLVRWHHRGLGIEKDSTYKSWRMSDEGLPSVTVTTTIDAVRMRGKKLEVKLAGRGKFGVGGDAGLWIQEERPDRQRGFYTQPEEQPDVGEKSTEIIARSRISDDAIRLVVGVQVIGESDVWLEPPVMTIDGKLHPLPAWGAQGYIASPWRVDSENEKVVSVAACGRVRSCVHASISGARAAMRPWAGSLGAGVAAMVPLALAAVDGKTVPAATAQPPANDATPLFMASDRTTRLVSVIIAWNIFQHFYPYFDVRNTDWASILPRSLAEAAQDDGVLPFLATLRRLVHDLHDGHGSVSHPAENRSWRVPWLWTRAEGKLVIAYVAPQCGCDLHPGDIVTSIDGVPTADAVAGAAATLSAASDLHLDAKALGRISFGTEGSRKRLVVQRGATTVRVEAALVAPDVTIKEPRPASGSEVAPGIRYVDINTTSREQWSSALVDLAAARGVIIDVRGYPGASVTLMLPNMTKLPISSAQWHFPTPARPDREGLTFSRSGWDVQPAAPFLPNVVFMTDVRAVSAAETFMGIVEHYKLGPIVGSATAGTNGNINPFTLPGGYLVWWTGMKVLKHDRSTHHGIGINPTVPATRTIAGIAARRDEVLEKAIEVANSRWRTRRQK